MALALPPPLYSMHWDRANEEFHQDASTENDWEVGVSLGYNTLGPGLPCHKFYSTLQYKPQVRSLAKKFEQVKNRNDLVEDLKGINELRRVALRKELSILVL